MKQFTFILISIFSFSNINAFAQSDSLKVDSTLNINLLQSSLESNHTLDSIEYRTDGLLCLKSKRCFFPSFLNNLSYQAKSPFNLNKKQAMLTGAVLISTFAFIKYDNTIDKWASTLRDKHTWVDKTSPFITQFGGTWGYLSVASIGTLSAISGNKKALNVSLLATQAAFTSGIWAQLIKTITGRERPSAAYIDNNYQGGRWSGPVRKNASNADFKKTKSFYDSFVSGHTATAFSIATTFASMYKDKPLVGIASYSLATIVGFSRLTEHAHWASDVFAGGLLGYVCAKQIEKNFKKTNSIHYNRSKRTLANISVFQQSNQVGLIMHLN